MRCSAILLFVASAVVAVTFDRADSSGYYLPSSGTASSTQFVLATELGSGTACGVSSLPNGKVPSGSIGNANGPGYLYVINLDPIKFNFLKFLDAESNQNKKKRRP